MEDNAVDFYSIRFSFPFYCWMLRISWQWLYYHLSYLPVAEFLDCLQLRAGTKKAVTNSPVQVSV